MATSRDYLSQYEQYQKNRTRPEDYIKKYSSELGVDSTRQSVADARAAINATQGVIRATPDSVAGRTSGSLVTDAQRNRLVQNELAPLNEALSGQKDTYGELRGNLSDLLEEAGMRSTAAYRADETQATTLKDLYDATFKAEQEAEARRRWEAEQAESKRQFDARMAEARRQGGSGGISPTFGGGGYGMRQRADKGFDFVDSSGRSVSAATYSAATGIPFRQLLQQMANAGDSGARQALGFVGDDYRYDTSKIRPGVTSLGILNLYKALTWGAI